MYRMYIIFYFLFFMSLNLYAAPSVDGLNGNEIKWLKEHPSIKVHNELDYIPINFYKNGKPQGYSIDYIRLIGKKLGIDIEFITGHTWDEYLRMAEKREIDVIMNVVETKERQNYLSFTQSYLKLYPFIYSNINNPVRSLEELNGKTLAIPKGYYFENLFSTNYPKIKLLKVADNLNAIKSVSLGQADATVGLSTTFEHLINEHFITTVYLSGEAKLNGMSKYFEKIGIRSDWEILKNILNKAINSITYEEERALKRKWNLILEHNVKDIIFNSQEKKWLKDNRTIKVHNEHDWAPFNFNKDGQPQGYSVDYIKLLASKVDINVEFISNKSWSESLDMLYKNKIDLVLNIAKTSKRIKKFNFTNKSYVKIQNGFVTQKTKPPIRSYSDLNGKTLAVVKDYAINDIIKKQYPDINILTVKNNTDLIKAVSYDKAYAGHGTIGSLQYIMGENFITNLQYSEDDKEPMELYIAVNKNNNTFLSILNKLQASLTNEEIFKLKRKWFLIKADDKKINFTADQLQWIKAHPVIKVGGETDWPPFDYVENGKYTGIAKDYLDLISEKTGLRFDVETGYTWSELLSMAKNKELDMLPMIYYSEERERFLNFTKPYLNVRHYLYTLDDKDFDSLKQLNGKIVAVPKGFAQADILRRNYPDIKIYEADNSLDCIDAVITKKADAFIENTALVTYFLKLHKISGIKAAFATELGVNKLYMATRKDWHMLGDIIQKALDSLTKDDTREVVKKWFTQDENSEKNGFLNDRQIRYLENKKDLTVCINETFLPIETYSNKKHIGIAADLLKLSREMLDINLNFIAQNSQEGILKLLKDKKCDLISAVNKNGIESKEFIFTEPYMSFPVVILTKDDKGFIGSLDSINNKIIAVSKSLNIAQKLKKRYKNITIVEVNTAMEGIKGLKSDQFYGFIDISASAYYNINKNIVDKVKIAGFLENDLEFSMSVHKDNPILLEILQNILDNISHQEKQKIIKNWISIEFEKQKDYSYLINILIISMIIILILTVVNFLLKRKINIEVNNQLKLKSYANEIDTIINASWTIQILNDGKDISRANRAFDSFFDMYDGYDDFKKHHHCICELFEDIGEEEYLADSKINGINWVEYLSNHSDKQFKAAIKKDGIMYHFIIHVNSIMLQNKKFYLIELIDVSHEIEQRKDIDKKNKIIAEQSKMAALGEMIGNIAHQWRQPLSIISLGATTIKYQTEVDLLDKSQIIKLSENINDNAQYLSKTIDDFRNFIKGDMKIKYFNLKESMESFLKLTEPMAKSNSIKIKVDIDDNIRLNGYPNELMQCFINIFNNAKDVLIHNDEDERYIFISQIINNNNIVIEFKDNAGGIKDNILPKIFEPYFTTKHQSQGTGLGLNMTYNLIVNGMKGQIDASNIEFEYNKKRYKGAVFRIQLPLDIESVNLND